MKKLQLSTVLFLFSVCGVYSQNTLFDQSRVSSVYIQISADTLNWLMVNVSSDHYCQAKFMYDDGTKIDTLQNVGFRLRGNTSRNSRKKSFKISFNEYVSGRNYQGVKKINLNGEHNDPTLIREKLFYDIWQKAGLAERRTSFVRLYINGAYYGLYTNLEEFDKDWLQRVYSEKSGNLYKCTWPADLVYKGGDQQLYKNIMSGALTGGRAYELQTNTVADDYTDLVDLITTLNQPVDASFKSLIEQKLDVDGFLKAMAIDVVSGNWDDYLYNKNNYFLYHRTDNGKFEFISYDTDNTFGVDWLNVDWATRNCMSWLPSGEQRPLASKLLSVPEYNLKYQNYLFDITSNITNPQIIFPHIDSLKALISDAALADTYRTLDWGYTDASFNNGFTQKIDSHTPYGVKSFFSVRYLNTMQQLPTTGVSEIENAFTKVMVFPNPVANELTLKAESSDYDRKGIILDMIGQQQRLFVLPAHQASVNIDFTELKPGVYCLLLIEGSQCVTQKIVKN